MKAANSLHYQQRIMIAAGQIGMDALRGHVTDANIQHDHWCLLLRGRGACNCVPNITMTCAGVVYVVDRDGNARRTGGASRRAL